MSQLSFELPHRTARGRADFFVSDANAIALAMVDDCDRWPLGKLLILGPRGSGKSHLMDIWCDATGGQPWSLDRAALPDDGARIAIDDIDHIAGDITAQTRMFHLHNHLMATGGRLLMTSTVPVAAAGYTLPDLASRLDGTTATRIDAPDDALIHAMILKQFMDRQIAPTSQVIQCIAKHVERSFEAIAALIADLDQRSMAQGSKITPKMVMAALADMN